MEEVFEVLFSAGPERSLQSASMVVVSMLSSKINSHSTFSYEKNPPWDRICFSGAPSRDRYSSEDKGKRPGKPKVGLCQSSSYLLFLR